MTDQELQDLVGQAAEVTGAPGPDVFRADGAALVGDVIEGRADSGDFYLVGLIGGKEVGKSALVNALAGARITDVTSHGPGTEGVIAYAHRSREAAVRRLLEREVAGRFRVVAHDVGELSRQVLLDLPDVDSRYADHLETTRRMLRHMLFPVWVQSVEKYADRQPQELLGAVAAGNDPANFLFCLNKVDQLRGAGDADRAELVRDFAARIARTLKLAAPPRVFAVSGLTPDGFDLPALRATLSRQKTEAAVEQGKALAGRQRERGVLAWLEGQDLPGRAARTERLAREAEEVVAERVGVPLLEQVVPAIENDAGHRLAMVDEVLAARVARWPLVNVVHAALQPVTAIVRANVGAAGRARAAGVRVAGGYEPEETLVEGHLRLAGRSVGETVQAAFAQLQQSHPAVSRLYRDRRLWEAMAADEAAGRLRQALAATVARQRAAVRESLVGRPGLIMPIVRLVLTVGALVWFPIVQPVLQEYLEKGSPLTTSEIIGLLVRLLGVTYVLQSLTFLVAYFVVIWFCLRWDAARRVAKLLGRWGIGDTREPVLSLSGQAVRWMEELTEPARESAGHVTALHQRVEALRAGVEGRAA